MAYGILKIKNIDSVDGTYCGQLIPVGEIYTVQDIERTRWQNSTQVFDAITLNKIQVGDDIEFYSDKVQQWNIILGNIPIKVSELPNPPPFAAKTFIFNGNVKKLYKRVKGSQHTLVQGINTILLEVPYSWAKMNALELIGGELLDKTCLFVLDTTTGEYSGYPNLVLNQFGCDTNIAKDYYRSESQYDADLYLYMQIKIVYTSVSAKTIAINVEYNEVKD